ncbi:MAG: mitochondrial small ribosomal subunit protein uS17m [Alphaproteobacteria bacterium]|nr:mitochondrial small ribosomal subunit protein uS17m [Rickettsiales bacterium]
MVAKVLEGTIVKLSGKKTVKVSVRTLFRHPLYRKSTARKKCFLCHSEIEDLSVGSIVKIIECRPRSKLKSWLVLKLVGV